MKNNSHPEFFFHCPLEVYILCFLFLLLSIGALYGGGALILQSDGSLLHMQSWLGKIPFQDFLIPGLILFIFNGVLPLIVITGLLFRPRWSFFNCLNLYKDKHWAWAFSLYSGIITVTWIIVQQFMTDYFILQPIVSLIGLIIVILTLLPGVIRHYTITQKPNSGI